MAGIEFSQEDLRTLATLDFTPVLKCDDRTAQMRCRDEARFSLRCKSCDEVTIYCPMHSQGILSALVVHCGRCRKTTGRAAVLFEIEPIS